MRGPKFHQSMMLPLAENVRGSAGKPPMPAAAHWVAGLDCAGRYEFRRSRRPPAVTVSFFTMYASCTNSDRTSVADCEMTGVLYSVTFADPAGVEPLGALRYVSATS